MILFEWDEEKNHQNIKKHGISFVDVESVFYDPSRLVKLDDRYDYGEERYQTIGSINGIIIIFVAYTYRDNFDNEVIRLISARRASKQEVKAYVNHSKNQY